MSETAKFRINLKTGEVEITGSEDFVERQINGLAETLEVIGAGGMELDEETGATDADAGGSPPSAGGGQVAGDEIPDTFGEWMHKFKDDVNDLEKALITARYVQSQSSENDFKTSEVNKSLQDHGIKLSNPSRSLKALADKKFLFQTRKVGKLRYMRVSKDGLNHLATIKRHG